MYGPYKSETDCALYRARTIWKACWKPCILWTLFYVLIPDGIGLLASIVPAPSAKLALFFAYWASHLFLFGLFVWIDRLIRGTSSGLKDMFHPFHWVKSQGLGRFLLLAGILFGASWVRVRLGNAFSAVMSAAVSGQYGDYFYQTSFKPVVVELFQLVTLWAVEYFIIRIVQADGHQTKGALLQGFLPAWGKMIRLEAKLIPRILWIPYLLYFLTKDAAYRLLDAGVYQLIYYVGMRYFFLFFGLVYFPLSAIARSILVMQQPLSQEDRTAPADFSRIDAQYADLPKDGSGT